MRTPRRATGRALGLVLDALGVVAFVVIGRAAHHHGDAVRGVLSTLWPFAVGLAFGWACWWRRSPLAIRTGVLVALTTVTLGMVLRVVSGQGTAAAFVAVAVGFLGMVMVGGRLLVDSGRRRRTRADSAG